MEKQKDKNFSFMKKTNGFSLLIMTFFMSCGAPNLQPEFTVLKIANSQTKETMFLKKETRGLNYEAIYLSLDSLHEYDELKDFYFNGSPVFYKSSNDSLLIMSSSFYKTPEKPQFKTHVFCSKFKENIDYINFEKGYRYKKLGYTKFD